MRKVTTVDAMKMRQALLLAIEGWAVRRRAEGRNLRAWFAHSNRLANRLLTNRLLTRERTRP
jgi:hypothetical protein